jgi:carboxylesterase
MSTSKYMNIQNNVLKRNEISLAGGPVGFLLLHGLGGTPVELRFLAQGLHRSGYTVLCPQLAGHGGSDMLLGATEWQSWLESAEQAFDRLRSQCSQVIIGGLSAGAVLSLHLAARRHDDIEGVTLFSPTFWPNGWAMPWYSILFRLIRHKPFANLFRSRVKPPYGIKDERIRRFIVDSLRSDGRSLEDVFGRRGGTVWEFKSMAAAAKRLLGEISKPVLICHAREDDQSDLSNAYRLQRDLAGPVELLVLDDCFHMITLDRQREQVLERTLTFAEKLRLQESEVVIAIGGVGQRGHISVVPADVPQSA